MRFASVVVLLAASSCLVDVSGAPCNADGDCPTDQRCVIGGEVPAGASGRCAVGARTGGGGGSTGGGGGDDGGTGGGTTGGGGGTTGGGGGTTGGGGGSTGGGGGSTGGGGGTTGGGGGDDDGGTDAGSDGGFDAGFDAGVDAGTDAGTDAGMVFDAGTDRCAGSCFSGGDCACSVYALHADLANTGDTMVLEGRFGLMGVRVKFPGPDGGTLVNATMSPGNTRATVTVPPTATAGPLEVQMDMATSTALTFRRASFPLGVSRFDPQLDQATTAAPMPRMSSARSELSSVIAGDWLFVVGGGIFAERARVHADGSIGRFQLADMNNYGKGHTLHLIGPYAYLVGGTEPLSSTATSSVWVARRDPIEGLVPLMSGQLFSVSNSLSLVTPRKNHASVIIGESLYVIGGRDDSNQPLGTIERAVIKPDGTLLPFEIVQGVTLATPRSGHSVAVFGNRLFVIGGRGAGTNGGMPLQGIEQTVIAGERLVGFTAAGVSLLNTRDGAAVVTFGNRLLVMGGVSVTGGRHASIETAQYNAATGQLGSFTVSAPNGFTRARAYFGTAVVGNSMYVIGGDEGVALDDLERASLNASGALGPPLPARPVFADPRIGLSLAVYGRNLFVLGGDPANTVARAVINPDYSLGPFAPVLGASLNKRRNARSAVVADTLYLVGSTQFDGGAGSAEVIARWRLNADGGLSNEASDGVLTVPRSGAALVALGNSLWAFGGRTLAGTPLSAQEVADTAQAGTVDFAGSGALLTPRAGHGVVVGRSALYLLGGNTADAGTASVERQAFNANGSLSVGSFTGFTLAPGGRTEFVTVPVGHNVYLFAGQRSGAPTSTVEVAAFDSMGVLQQFGESMQVSAPDGGVGHAAIVLGNSLYYFVGTQLVEYPLQ